MSTGRQGGWAWVSVWHGSAPLFNSFGLGQCFPMRVFLSSHHHILHHSLLKWFGEIIWISFDMLFNYPLKNLNIYTSLLNFFIEFCGNCPQRPVKQKSESFFGLSNSTANQFYWSVVQKILQLMCCFNFLRNLIQAAHHNNLCFQFFRCGV